MDSDAGKCPKEQEKLLIRVLDPKFVKILFGRQALHS